MKKQLDRKKLLFCERETVHYILNLPKKYINQNPESLNQYFTELASKLINKENVAFDQRKLTTIIPELEI